MQHRNATSDNLERPATSWHPFSWRRMKPWQSWALLGTAAAFIVIGLIVI
jgi:hypothetical protein